MKRTLGTLSALLLLCTVTTIAHAQVEIDARISRSQLSVGETTTLDVVVRGATGDVQQPQFAVPPGVEILGSSRAQNFSWINGRSSSETAFRFEIGPMVAGTHRIGPIEVRVGDRTFRSRALTLRVSAASQRVEGDAGDSDSPASLTVTVEPSRPFVGEPVILRVRLIQRAQLAEDPRYIPPATPGFWSEDASRPESYYADQNRQRVLVTETRTRMYPIGVGAATVGSAIATLALAVPGAIDPLQILRGRVPRREITLRSEPVNVDVRALPSNAPDGFDGAVGELQTRWSADRTETRLDMPITLRFDVRGVGNLPLVQAPPLRSDAFEIFSSTVEDSFPPPGSLRSGRRRFLWTALPRREGTLEVSAPAFAWFDPDAETYRRAPRQALSIEVGPALIASGDTEGGFPSVFRNHPLDPFGREAAPWAWGIAGFALGLGVLFWRKGGERPADAGERARQREWLRVIGLARGPAFWRAAEEAMGWAESRGRDVHHLRREIAAARYGRSEQNLESVRRRVVEHVSQSLPAEIPRWPMRTAGVALLIAAPVICLLFGPGGGSDAGVLRARQADEAARSGDVASARAEWQSLWAEGARSAQLAARLAWADVREGSLAPAVVWVLRGESLGGRNGSLDWVRDRVREAGGMTGAGSARFPLNPIEWSVLALVAAAAAVILWPRRSRAVPAAIAALAFMLVMPIEGAWHARVDRGVMRDSALLEGPDLQLEPGQVVRIIERMGERTRVAAGRGVEGWVSTGLVDSVKSS